MMLKFTSEQLDQLQTGLAALQAPPPCTPHTKPPPVCMPHPKSLPPPACMRPHPSAEKGPVAWELWVPHWAITAGYALVGLGLGACLLGAPGHLHACSTSLCPVLVLTLLLHACTARSPLCVALTAALVATAPYVCYAPPGAGVHCWCVALCLAYTLHADAAMRVLGGCACVALCGSVAVSLSSTAPPYVRHAGTALSLAVGYLAACLSRRHAYIRIRVDTLAGA